MALIDQLRSIADDLDRLRSPAEREQLTGWAYRSSLAFVAAEGRVFESVPLTHGERVLVNEAVRIFRLLEGRFEWQQCYAHSQITLEFDLSRLFQYAEGFISDSGGTPELHAWLVLHDKVVDFTGPPSLPLPDEPPHVLGELGTREYVGVIFPRTQVLRRFGRDKDCGSLIEDDEMGFPFLRCGRTGRLGRRRTVPKRLPREIWNRDLDGLPGLRRRARDGLLHSQPTTVREALRIPDVGRKTTRHLAELGLLDDPEGVQFRSTALVDREGPKRLRGR